MPQSPHCLRNDLKCVEWDVKLCSIQSTWPMCIRFVTVECCCCFSIILITEICVIDIIIIIISLLMWCVQLDVVRYTSFAVPKDKGKRFEFVTISNAVSYCCAVVSSVSSRLSQVVLMEYLAIVSAVMVSGLFLWPALQYGTGYQTV